MAVTILSIIGTVFAVIIGLVSLFTLPLISKALKGLNRMLKEKAGVARIQVRESLEGLESTEAEIEAFAAMNEATRSGIKMANSAMGRVQAFLESKPFQVGFPLIFSALLLIFALPRGLFARVGKKKRTRRIVEEAVEEEPAETGGE